MSATSMPWVKMYTELLDDPKLGTLTDSQKWRFIQLILLAGQCDKEGLIDMTTKEIAWRLRIDNETMANDLQELQKIGIIEPVDDHWIVCKFAERQGRPQSVKRDQWREAQQRHRGVIDDSSMSHTPRGEERREEEIREEE